VVAVQKKSFLVQLLGGYTMKKLITLLGMLAFAASLSACNTFKGMGQDVERGGEKVQDAAGSTQKKM
jgi:entericidin B